MPYQHPRSNAPFWGPKVEVAAPSENNPYSLRENILGPLVVYSFSFSSSVSKIASRTPVNDISAVLISCGVMSQFLLPIFGF